MWGLVCWVCNRHLVVGYHMGFVESLELGMWNLGFGVCVGCVRSRGWSLEDWSAGLMWVTLE